MGIAIGSWFYFAQANTEVRVGCSPSGGIVARCAVQDMGNGARSVIAATVAAVFQIPPSQIDVRVGDSSLPSGPMSAGSRTTASVVYPARVAAEQLRDELLEIAVRRGSLTAAKPGAGGIDHASGHLPWSELIAAAGEQSFSARRGRDPGGWFRGIALNGLGLGKALTGAVIAAEVEVDTRLGRVRVPRVWAGYAVGRIVCPELARSQAWGGVVQGVGYALYEERRNDAATGRILTRGLEDYRVPGIGDCPEIDVHFEESSDWTPAKDGSMGIAELSSVPVSPAIGNAVFHATGWRCRQLPIRPDRVLEGLRA
jgi:xanthine dehydrogenase YagR molybdenum-binding subunit